MDNESPQEVKFMTSPKFKPWLIWLLAITSIALFVLTLILTLQNQQLKAQLGQRSTPASRLPVAVVTPTPDPTAGWLTYQNNQYGFEFKYPSNMVAVEARNEWDDLVGLYFQESNPNQIGSGDIRVLVSHNPEIKDIFTFYGNARSSQSGDPIFTLLDENGQKYDQIIMKKTASGQNVYQLDDQYCVVACQIATFLKDDYVYRIIGHDGVQVIQDQIISTFRFLNKLQPVSTVQWKTFKDENMGFEIKYPADLDIERISNNQIRVWQDKNRPTLPPEAATMHFNPAVYFIVLKEENVNLSFLDWVRNKEGAAHESMDEEAFKKRIKLSQINLGNNNLYFYNGLGIGEGTFNYVFINETDYIIFLSLESQKTIDNDPIFKQILTTFEFLN